MNTTQHETGDTLVVSHAFTHDSHPQDVSRTEQFLATLQDMRRQRNWSQSELAERMAYGPSYVSKVCGGRCPVTEQFAERADEALDADGQILEMWRRGASGAATPARPHLRTRTAAPDVMLAGIPHGLSAHTLAGPWVTCFEFLHHGQTRRRHADIAQVVTVTDRRVRATNHSPTPRSEGRVRPFHNEIDVQLVGRHLVGVWKNTSDTRYFGAVQLAVLPGETVLDGYFTGVGSDVEVSVGRWRWVRLDCAEDVDLSGVLLGDPAGIFDRVMDQPYDGAPLALDEIREDV